MYKAKIIITGKKIHEIGYRVFLLTNALNFGIGKFHAYNTRINDMQTVIVLIEGSRDIIDDFYDHVTENIPDDAIVEDLKIEDFTGNVVDIDRYLHLIQVEQLNKGIPAILDIRDNTKTLLEKQDSMLEKQDSLLRVTEKGFTDMKAGFREVKEEIHLMRDDFREMFMHEVSELRGEIADIKATLARMQAAG
jgi:acylphosphatase